MALLITWKSRRCPGRVKPLLDSASFNFKAAMNLSAEGCGDSPQLILPAIGLVASQ
jgi:hypothetical protein